MTLSKQKGYDVILTIRFLLPEEGGLSHDIVSVLPNGNTVTIGCPLFVDGHGFDCRIISDMPQFKLGHWYTVKIKLLSPELALPKLISGKKVELWSGKTIARGVVE